MILISELRLLIKVLEKGSLANHYEVIYEHCDDQEVAVVLDGDDAFAGNDVLSYLNEIYCTKNVWLSYGQFRELNGGNIGFCRPVPQEIVRRHRFRAWELMPSHLRTYYVWLFKKIKKKIWSIKAEISLP